MLAGIAVVVRWVYLAATGVTFEDSLISLRYAHNLASGLGMVYNPGEKVFGASTPLYVLFLAALSYFHLPALLIAKLGASLLDGATLFLWGHWLWRRTERLTPVLFFFLLFTLCPVLVLVSISGMETSLAMFCLTAALISDQDDYPALCGLALGGLMLLRPDGALAAAVILGMRWWRAGRAPWLSFLLAAVLVLPWLVTATLYYGSPIPHSIPAKAAAYNLHRPFYPGFRGTLAQLVPFVGAPGQIITVTVLAPFLIAGLAAGFRRPQFRPLAVLFLTWWAFLVLPRTLIFLWYLPFLLLPAYVLAALGFSNFQTTPSRPLFPEKYRRKQTVWCLLVLTGGLCAWIGSAGWTARRTQHAENTVRRAIGLWLRNNTPEDSRIAMEPIGYIGYYSHRRILDEVGLVSPEMVPLNRDGDGWFGKMLRLYHPDYIVERPAYLVRNLTLNSNVLMFDAAEERDQFLAEYEPVARFGTLKLTPGQVQDYRFVIYARRSRDSARAWSAELERRNDEQREDLTLQALTGPVPRPRRTGPAATAMLPR